jgi:hypothetical protein
MIRAGGTPLPKSLLYLLFLAKGGVMPDPAAVSFLKTSRDDDKNIKNHLYHYR